MKKYYKVVREDTFGIYSGLINGLACVKYEIGKFVGPPEWLSLKGYHLLVFESEKSATAFFYGILHGSIYECEVWGVVKELPYMGNMGSLENGILCRSTEYWPEGTVMAKRVSLIKKIK